MRCAATRVAVVCAEAGPGGGLGDSEKPAWCAVLACFSLTHHVRALAPRTRLRALCLAVCCETPATHSRACLRSGAPGFCENVRLAPIRRSASAGAATPKPLRSMTRCHMLCCAQRVRACVACWRLQCGADAWRRVGASCNENAHYPSMQRRTTDDDGRFAAGTPPPAQPSARGACVRSAPGTAARPAQQRARPIRCTHVGGVPCASVVNTAATETGDGGKRTPPTHACMRRRHQDTRAHEGERRQARHASRGVVIASVLCVCVCAARSSGGGGSVLQPRQRNAFACARARACSAY